MGKAAAKPTTPKRLTERSPGTWEMISDATVMRVAREAGWNEAELGKLDARSVAIFCNIAGVDLEGSQFARQRCGRKIQRFTSRATRAREGVSLALAHLPSLIAEMESWPTEFRDDRLPKLKAGLAVLSELLSILAPARTPGGREADHADFVAGVHTIVSRSIGPDAIKEVPTAPGVRFISALVSKIFGWLPENAVGGTAPMAEDECEAIVGLLRRQRAARK